MSHGGGGGGGGVFGGGGGHHSGGHHHMGGEPEQSAAWTQAYQAEKDEGGWGRFFRKIRTTPATLMGLLFLGMTGWLFVVYASSHGGASGDKKNLADLRYFPTNKYEHSIRSASISTPWQRDSTKRVDFASQNQPEEQPAEAPAAQPVPRPAAVIVAPPQRSQDFLSQQSVEGNFNSAFGSSTGGGGNSFVPSSAGNDTLQASATSNNDSSWVPKSGGDVVNYSIPVSPRLSARASASGLVPPPPPTYNQSSVTNSVRSLAQAYAISQLDGTQGAGTSLAGLLTQSRSDFGGAPGEVAIAPPAGTLFPPPPGIPSASGLVPPPPPGQVTQTQSSDGGSTSTNKNPYVKTLTQAFGSSGSRTKMVVSR
jgi:hypothetical protein